MVVHGGETVATNVVGRGVGLQSRDDGTLYTTKAQHFPLPKTGEGGRRKGYGNMKVLCVCSGIRFPPRKRKRG